MVGQLKPGAGEAAVDQVGVVLDVPQAPAEGAFGESGSIRSTAF